MTGTDVIKEHIIVASVLFGIKWFELSLFWNDNCDFKNGEVDEEEVEFGDSGDNSADDEGEGESKFDFDLDFDEIRGDDGLLTKL